ncbi:hypothetical protein NUW54_g3730 [Trametes sanguinea]|uniref:Uncharacterized protein n=1 Tax=Trametes sanguinea TaxID=158606 RepID=A0ACC1Q2F0_9APHY|nr:hypothetical protein NUW54_g3730 [Trametes sanguinea]
MTRSLRLQVKLTLLSVIAAAIAGLGLPITMALRYEELGCLARGHTNVAAVAFSYRGTYIATAGVTDCTVCVWRVTDQKRLHTVRTSTVVLSIEWLSQREDIFVIGTQGGAISTVHIELDTLNVKGFWAHRHPIEHLSASGSWLASGAKASVAIWQSRDEHKTWKHLQDLPQPTSSLLNEDSEILVTSLHWTTRGGHGRFLLPIGITLTILTSIFNTGDWSIVRNIPLPGVIAHSSVSPDGRTIAISNMLSGFDLYDLESQAVLRSFTHPVDMLRAVPVKFVHGGYALLGGSTAGIVHLWNVHNGHVHQKFSLGASSSVMAIDVSCHILDMLNTWRIELDAQANYDAASNRFLIAAGISDGHIAVPVTIWVARDIGRREAPIGRRLLWPSLGIAFVAIPVIVLWFPDWTPLHELFPMAREHAYNMLS